MNILFFQIEDASGQRPYPISILQSSRATRPTLGPITQSHHTVPTIQSHHTVPLYSPTIQSHYTVPLYSPTIQSHHTVPSHSPITQSHHTAITLGKTVTLLPIPIPTTLFYSKPNQTIPNQTKPNQTKNIFSPFQSNGEKQKQP